MRSPGPTLLAVGTLRRLLTTIATVAVLGFFASRLIRGLLVARRGTGRATIRAVVRRIRFRHVWPVPLLLGAVMGVATLLVQIPGLDWGWWTALGGQGNPVFGSSDATAGTVFEWLIPVVFVSLLLPALPLFAFAEEQMFRTGAEHWSPQRRVLKVVQFGMVHALIGIPIGVAMALSIGGVYFMWVYLRRYARTRSSDDATLESTTAHTVYNGVIIVVVLISFISLALGA